MSPYRRIRSPRVVRPHSVVFRVVLVLAGLAVILLALGASFVSGVMLEREESNAIRERASALEQEGATLNDQIAELKEQGIVLERTQQIDREANRSAQERLKEAQDERLALEKEVSFLRRLIREGGGGILQIKDFMLAADEAGRFAYSFAITQLIQDFGESEGSVEITLVGKQEGKEKTLSLDKLAGSTAATHKMKFQHFQNFEGRIKLPEDFEPENLVVEVKPTTKKLIPITETFAWITEE